VYAQREPAIETVAPVAASPRADASSRLSRLLGSLRERTTTTPGRLLLVSVVTVVGAIVFGAIATSAERSRAHAATAVSSQTEPLLVQAETLYTTLSDANATATTTFLNGGPEPPSRGAQYLSDLQVASDSLAALAREVGGSPQAQAAVRTITEQLPLYAGLVDTARTNNRQGLPVGAAYLRQASALLTSTILPAADRIYATEATRLGGDYGSGTSTVALIVLIVVTVAALALLIAAQRYLSQVSRRTINVPMFAGTLVLLAVSVWATVGLLSEQSSLKDARRGSDSVELLSAARVLLSRVQTDQSLTLVNRGSDETDPADLKLVMDTLAPDGVLGWLPAPSATTGTATGRIRTEFDAYRDEVNRITRLQDTAGMFVAIQRASSQPSRTIADRLNRDVETRIAAMQRRFAASAADATGALSGLTLAIPLLTALAAGLALLGLRERLGEYR
jgi:hypothetical protein